MAGAQAGIIDLPVSTVRRAAQMCGLKEVGEDEEWTVYWTDCSVSLERVMDMKRFQVPMSWPNIQNEYSHPVCPGTGDCLFPLLHVTDREATPRSSAPIKVFSSWLSGASVT